MNGYDSSLMTAYERMEEAADILAAGILRLRKKKSSEKHRKGETIYLDNLVGTRLHVTRKQTKNGEIT